MDTVDLAMHRILVTNDDGVYASGLQAAAKSVQGLGEVIVVGTLRADERRGKVDIRL